MGRCAAHGACTLALLGVGCLPEVEPPWLVDELTVPTVTTRVVGLGPLAPERGSFVWPAPMVDALPGDVLELEAIVMDEDGELVAEQSRPRWLLCGWESGQCPPGSSGRRPGPCALAPATPLAETCVLGDGPITRFMVGPLRELPGYVGLIPGNQVVLAAGTPGTSTGEECLDRLQGGEASVDDPLWDCRFSTFDVVLGPTIPLVLAAEEAGIEIDPPSSELPPELANEQPNRAPVIEGIAIERPERGDELAYGAEPIELSAGELVRIFLQIDPTSAQTYYGLGFFGGELAVDEYQESIYVTWFSAEPLEDVAPTEGFLPYRQFRMPESGRVRHVVVVEDGRGARTWKIVDLAVSP